MTILSLIFGGAFVVYVGYLWLAAIADAMRRDR